MKDGLFANKWVRRVLLAVGILSYYAVMFFIMDRLDIGCFYKYFFGIPCPGCGMTRALRCILEFDFIGAFKYNPVIFFMPYIFAYIFFDFKGRIHNYILIFIAVIAVVNWGFDVFMTLA